MNRLKFVAAGPMQTYRVLADGEDIGEVRFWSVRYNLRRVIVTKGWRARTAAGEALYTRDGCTAGTRAGAAEALLERAMA